MPFSSPQAREAALFALALKQPLGERDAFLQAVSGEDQSLRSRLEAMLATHEQPKTLLATQAESVRLREDALARQARPTIKLDLADAPHEAVGQTLGRYKLLERVGEGGCGVVYVAEQTEPVRRRVALKVIKLGMYWPDEAYRPYVMSLLGASLAGQKKYAEAEPLLLQSCQGLQQHQTSLAPYLNAPRRITESLERLVQLYDVWGKPTQAAEWKKKLAEFQQAAKAVEKKGAQP